MTNIIKEYLEKATTQPLTMQESLLIFSEIIDGKANDCQIAGLLMSLKTRGETIDEYTAAAQVMRNKSIKIEAPDGAIDIVGTGGDGKKTLNISTAASFVVAGAGVFVAKHGNKNLSSLSGSADVLTHSGVNIYVEPKVVEKCIKLVGIGFMMAPLHHPAVKNVMPARQALGIRTIFNILGPLTNPASVKYQLSGAYSADLLEPMIKSLRKLGSKSAWVVHGKDGTDEISISGPTKVLVLEDDKISTIEISPNDAGLPVHPLGSIIGGSPQENSRALLSLLEGKHSAYRDTVLLNSAAALVIAKKVSSLKEGVKKSIESIDSGAALNKLEYLIKLTSKVDNGK